MMKKQDTAVSTAQRAYAHALASGAKQGVAFDVACAAYRASHPALDDQTLRVAVALEVALTREELVAIQVSGTA
jgi:hypothetical protein